MIRIGLQYQTWYLKETLVNFPVIFLSHSEFYGPWSSTISHFVSVRNHIFSAKKINGTHWRKVMILTIYVLFTFFAGFAFIILVPKYCPSHKINWSKEKWFQWIEKFIQICINVLTSMWSFHKLFKMVIRVLHTWHFFT